MYLFGIMSMFFLTSKSALLSRLCFLSVTFSGNNQAQTSGGTLTGRIGGVEVQVQGNSALFKNRGLSQAQDASYLSMLMQRKGISQFEIRPDRMVIYRNHSAKPDTLNFPLPIEPAPTSTGIEIVDQSTGLLLLSSQVIKLASSVISATPLLEPQRRYTESESAPTYKIAFFEDDENEWYATTPIPVATPIPSDVCSYVREEGYIDLDFDVETLNSIRVYPKGKDSHSASGSFEQIIRKAHNGQEKKESEKQETSSSTQTTQSGTGSSIASTSTQAATVVIVTPTPVARSAPVDSLPVNSLEDESEPPLTEFKSYPEIENSSKESFVKAIYKRALGDQPWVILEKIHGSNYSFWTNGKVVKVARRHGWLSDGDEFFDHRSVYEKYRQHVLEMHKKFCREGSILTVTGELYGGTKIQKNIYYKDNMNFAAFDIFVNNERIDYDSFKEWTEATAIPRAPEVAILTSFDEALQYNPEFVSHLSERRDLAEGIVIKPVTPAYLPGGNPVIF